MLDGRCEVFAPNSDMLSPCQESGAFLPLLSFHTQTNPKSEELVMIHFPKEETEFQRDEDAHGRP